VLLLAAAVVLGVSMSLLCGGLERPGVIATGVLGSVAGGAMYAVTRLIASSVAPDRPGDSVRKRLWVFFKLSGLLLLVLIVLSAVHVTLWSYLR
jgi:hypothetical protein